MPEAEAGIGARRPAPQTVLAFDFGTRRIGVAVGQRVTNTASPLQVLSSRGGEIDWPAIRELVEQWQPDALVVGIPLNMDGSEQDMTRRSRRFARQLMGRFPLPVYEADERLSTREAWSELAARGRSPRSGEIDHQAAALILETWLKEQT